jgi:hypothetical protein
MDDRLGKVLKGLVKELEGALKSDRKPLRTLPNLSSITTPITTSISTNLC